ncbi:MAG: tetratricopeptide repeat protein [Myxococcota bacterium]
MTPIRPAPLRCGLEAGLVLATVLLVASALLPGESRAQSEPAARALGLSLARDGRCEAALEVLEPLRARPARDAELERRVGECAIRLERFALAIEALEGADALAPGSEGLALRLGQAYYHAGRIDDAERALARASVQGDPSPELLFYSGLVALDRGDLDRAIERLDAAVATADASIEPAASFQLARAQARARDLDAARRSYGRVVEGWSGTAWADQAARAITVLDQDETIPVWASAELGFEADDNALIRGRGVGRPQELSGQSDVRGYWFVDTGVLWLRRGAWSAGASVRYGGAENRRIERFDTHAPGATLWLDRGLAWNEAMLRLQYDVDAAWIGADTLGDDPFVVSHLWSASLVKGWSNGGLTTLTPSIGLDDYGYRRAALDVPDVSVGGCLACSPDGVDEVGATDRDGFGPIVSLVHRLPLPEPGVAGLSLPWIEAGYRYQNYVSQGREYDHQRHQVELAAGIRLPFDVDLSVRGRYAYVPYANRSVFPDPKDFERARQAAEAASGTPTAYFLDNSARREQETGVRVVLQRAFGEHVLVAARWSRTRNRSTADVFDYARDLVGVSVRVGWGN